MGHSLAQHYTLRHKKNRWKEGMISICNIALTPSVTALYNLRYDDICQQQKLLYEPLHMSLVYHLNVTVYRLKSDIYTIFN